MLPLEKNKQAASCEGEGFRKKVNKVIVKDITYSYRTLLSGQSRRSSKCQLEGVKSVLEMVKFSRLSLDKFFRC